MNGFSQRGFVLLPVVVLLALLAALAWLMSHDSIAVADRVQRAEQGHLARYVAEAALTHARWRANESGCTGYALPSTAFGAHTYSAQFTPNSGSPVHIAAVATLDNGVGHTLSRSSLAVYEAVQTLVIQPAAAAGKDAWLDGTFFGLNKDKNYGVASELELWLAASSIALQFDLSVFTADARIESAQLSMYKTGGSGLMVVKAYRITRDWSEGSGDSTVTADGATWDDYDGVSAWASPGGDYELAAVDQVDIGAVNNVRYGFDLGGLARRWIADPAGNHGVLLRRAAGSASQSRFASSDHATAANHPSLTVQYRCVCGTSCYAAAPVASAGNLLMVVDDGAVLSAGEQYKQSLIEGFGYTVTVIGSRSSAAAIRAAALASDVVFIGADVLSTDLGTKLTGVHLGVVNEEPALADEFGIWQSWSTFNASDLDIADTSHYITQMFSLGALTLFSGTEPMAYRGGSIAGGATVLGTLAGAAALAAVDKVADLYTGSTAAGKRVQLPWIGDYDPTQLSADGVTLLQRSLQWAAQPPDLLTAAYLDRFESMTCAAATDYSNSDGVLDWSSAAWSENDDNDSCAGNVRVDSDGGDNALYVNDDAVSIRRAVNLDAASFATLLLDYRRESLDDAGDALRLEVSANGGGSWTEVARIEGPATDGTYQSLSVDLMAWAGADTVIRLLGDGLERNGASPDKIWIDDLRIETDSAGGPIPGGCTSFLLDDFEANGFANNAGTLNWSSDWLETGESDGPSAGSVRVTGFGGSSTLWIGGKDRGAWRWDDLTGSSSAILSYDYRRNNLNKSDQYVQVLVSNNAGGSWAELARHEGPGSDGSWQSVSVDISAYISNQTALAFLASKKVNSSKSVYFDNVKICVQ